MPFKHNVARRHRIPKRRHRVTNWPAYEAGLRRRGELTFWIDEAALAGWQAPRRTTPGGQPRTSDLAIELVLTLRLVFHLALRQAEAFTRSVLRLLGLEMAVPDHTTLSRRGRAFAGRSTTGCPARRACAPRAGQHRPAAVRPGRVRCREARPHPSAMAQASPCRGCRQRRDRRRRSDQGHADDAAQAPGLLGQAEGCIVTVPADGACDSDAVYQAASARLRIPTIAAIDSD